MGDKNEDTRNQPSTSKDSENTKIDPSKDVFDPLAALYCKDLARSKKHIIYDNLAMFETALQRRGISEVGKKPKLGTNEKRNETEKSKSSTPTINERRFLPHQMPVKGPGLKVRHSRNLFKQMESMQGPLASLYKMLRKEIKIYTRKEHGIRGHVTGQLVAFDKHWNVLIENACETWQRRKFKFSTNGTNLGEPQNCSERLKNLGIHLPIMEIKSLNRKYVNITRKINQILIRGEQIALIVLLNKDVT